MKNLKIITIVLLFVMTRDFDEASVKKPVNNVAVFCNWIKSLDMSLQMSVLIFTSYSPWYHKLH